MSASGRRPGPRTLAALLVVLLYAAVSGARWVAEAARAPAAPARDEISANDRRFAPLRRVFAGGGHVGYLGDPPVDTTLPNGGDAALLHFRRYLLAQYALAPAILVDGDTALDLVVGNFEPGHVRPTPPGFLRARSPGDGLVLYRRVVP